MHLTLFEHLENLFVYILEIVFGLVKYNFMAFFGSNGFHERLFKSVQILRFRFLQKMK